MGKVLRINLDGTIPADNPFVGQAGKRGEIFAYGFRNPFRFSFDPLTGKLWVADVGDSTVEEIDIVTSGGNYALAALRGHAAVGLRAAGRHRPHLHLSRTAAPSSLGDLHHRRQRSSGQRLRGPRQRLLLRRLRPAATSTSAAADRRPRDGVEHARDASSAAGDTPSDMIFGPDGALYYASESGGEVRRVAPDRLRRRSARLRLEAHAEGQRDQPGEEVALRSSRRTASCSAAPATTRPWRAARSSVIGAGLRRDATRCPAANWLRHRQAGGSEGIQVQGQQACWPVP